MSRDGEKKTRRNIEIIRFNRVLIAELCLNNFLWKIPLAYYVRDLQLVVRFNLDHIRYLCKIAKQTSGHRPHIECATTKIVGNLLNCESQHIQKQTQSTMKSSDEKSVNRDE